MRRNDRAGVAPSLPYDYEARDVIVMKANGVLSVSVEPYFLKKQNIIRKDPNWRSDSERLGYDEKLHESWCFDPQKPSQAALAEQ